MNERIRRYATWAMVAAVVLLACAGATHSAPAGLAGLGVLLAGTVAFMLSIWYEHYWLDLRETEAAKRAKRVLPYIGFPVLFLAGIGLAVAITS